MNVSYQWLERIVPTGLSPEALADVLTFLGLNVEEIIPLVEAPLTGVVMAKILKVEGRADGTHWCQVDAGSEGRFTVVSGAPNCEAGRLAVLALPDTPLPDGRVIQRRTFDDGVSEGMLCSAHELGLSQGPSDYLLLSDEGTPGEPARTRLGLDDYRFELDLTPNYAAHCQSVFGIAREIAAARDLDFKPPVMTPEIEEGLPTDIDVTVEADDLCPRYSAAVIEGVSVEPSPWAIQRDLLACNLRPINQVVDLTNHLMLKWGQPLHAFDLDRIEDRQILVRRARKGETLLTLDSHTRALTPEDLVIADADRAIGLAGIIGGAKTEVTESTRNILLESAYFDPKSILLSARRLGVKTEASVRFEKGRDPKGTLAPMFEMMANFPDQVTGWTDHYPRVISRRRLNLKPAQVNQRLGTTLTPNEMRRILIRLGFDVMNSEDDEPMAVTVPSWRADILQDVCLTEEIARLYGYNQIPMAPPKNAITGYVPPKGDQVIARLRQQLVGMGFQEVLTDSWMGDEVLRRLATPDDHAHRQRVPIMNPMRAEQSHMRSTLLGSMLQVVEANRRRALRLQFFEINKVYRPRQLPLEALPQEKDRLCLAMLNKDEEGFWGADATVRWDYFDLKGILEGLLRTLNITDWQVRVSDAYFLHPGRRADLIIAGREIGSFGELHPDLAERLHLDVPVLIGELDVEALSEAARPVPQYQPVPEYPASTRDIALFIDDDISHDEIVRTIEGAASALLESVHLFDVYRGGAVPDGQKSVAYRLTYRDPKGTLTDAQVDSVHEDIRQALRDRLDAQLRS